MAQNAPIEGKGTTTVMTWSAMNPQGRAFRGTGTARYGSTCVDSESTLVEVESIVATSDSDLLLRLQLLVKVGQKSSRSRVESSRVAATLALASRLATSRDSSLLAFDITVL
ncbi:hypothetical protein DL93DRAFT_2101337 [Clavulina sp. PMI_390]|nr:hypothetical protein DL93DRAFT_2101337 [Clavulina sp. PMI_390]